MFPGSPAPLPPATRLRDLLRALPPGAPAGAWVRDCRSVLTLGPARRRVVLSRDLGALLRRCDRIAVRRGGAIAVFPASQLIRCRVLEIVLGTPFLPPPSLLRELFPNLRAHAGVVTLPIGLGSAEEALAVCAAARVPVRSSRVGYALRSG